MIIRKKNTSAFTLVEVLVVTVILGLIAAISIPIFMNSMIEAEIRIKQTNVATVESAKEQWALLNNKPNGTPVTWEDITDYMSSGITNQADLNVGGCSITLNDIGTSASY